MGSAVIVKPFALCMTGISGSGKTTLANAVAGRLQNSGAHIEVVDGDDVRAIIDGLFGHSKEERVKISGVYRAIGYYLLRNGVSFILAVIAPYEEVRSHLRGFFGEAYIQIYVKASAGLCAERDVKGLYKRQREGSITSLIGIDSVFEPPANSELVIDTERLCVGEACDMITNFLYSKGYLTQDQ